MSEPKIILYTSYACPWAHRAQIALAELKVPFETIHIDLTVPRTAEYLSINPRGVVPSLLYNDEIVTESAIIAQFLADTFPSHLLKTSTEEGGALQRARINFFVDAFSKAYSNFFPTIIAKGDAKIAAGEKFVDAFVKQIEPLLPEGGGPFFGGSKTLTFAEVLTGSFVLRLLAFSKYEKVLPSTIPTSLEAEAPKFWKWAQAIIKEESVTKFWDEAYSVDETLKKVALM